MVLRRRVRGAGLAAAAALILAVSGCSGSSDDAVSPSGSAVASGPAGTQILMDDQSLTTLDQDVAYPKKRPAQVSVSIVSLEPGQETGWHKHRTPMYVYVLEGTVSVEYDAGVVKEYPAGTAVLEAVDVWHNGTNKGSDTVRMLVVNMGAKGVKDTVTR